MANPLHALIGKQASLTDSRLAKPVQQRRIPSPRTVIGIPPPGNPRHFLRIKRRLPPLYTSGGINLHQCLILLVGIPRRKHRQVVCHTPDFGRSFIVRRKVSQRHIMFRIKKIKRLRHIVCFCSGLDSSRKNREITSYPAQSFTDFTLFVPENPSEWNTKTLPHVPSISTASVSPCYGLRWVVLRLAFGIAFKSLFKFSNKLFCRAKFKQTLKHLSIQYFFLYLPPINNTQV